MSKRQKKNKDSQENDSPYIQESSKNHKEINLDSKQIEGSMIDKKKRNRYTEHQQGKWRKEEDQIYVRFILQNRSKLASKTIRRSTRVFRQLAQQLGFQRTPEQCRMHHQRMKRKSRGRSITAIAKFIQKKYNIKFDQLANNKSNIIPKDQNIDQAGGILKKQGIATDVGNQRQYELNIIIKPSFGIQVLFMVNNLSIW